MLPNRETRDYAQAQESILADHVRTLVLGIETTCDETAAAVVERLGDGSAKILSNVVRSQVEEHAIYGGVVPEIAARAHVDLLDGIVDRAMKDAGVSYAQLSAVAAAATADSCEKPTPASFIAVSMMPSSRSTWARAAISGTTPP